MTTPYPLISLSRGDSLLSLIRIQMENIKRNETFNELKKYQQIFGSMPFGICCISRAASLSIVASNFTSISSDCFGIKESKLSISSSNFNNSALTSDLFLSKDSETLINKKSGVTWIKIEGISTSIADGDKILLQKNIFTANHLLPLYGGVIFIIHFSIHFSHLGSEFQRSRASSSNSRVKPVHWEFCSVWRRILFGRSSLGLEFKK